MAEEMKRLCACSPECKAVVKTAGRKYARGHNPAFWARERVPEAADAMTAEGNMRRAKRSCVSSTDHMHPRKNWNRVRWVADMLTVFAD